MNYAQYREKKYPIGSGVTEAACKTLVKQRDYAVQGCDGKKKEQELF